MTTAKDVGSIILLVLLSPLAFIALLLGSVFAIPIYIIGVIVAFARHDELSDWKTRIKVSLFRVAAGVLAEAEDHEGIRFPGQQVGRLSGRLKKWNAGRIRRTETKLGK
jgi:hypothetical protein